MYLMIVEDGEAVVGQLALWNLILPVQVPVVLGQLLHQILAAPPQQLIVDADGAAEAAQPALLGGLEAQQPCTDNEHL